MNSLRNGLFYSSTEPEIYNVQIEDETINVKTSPAQSINFIARNGLGRRFFVLNKPLRKATYTIRGN